MMTPTESDASTELRISVRNTSDTGGTFLTPTWFGFHDGAFDLFEGGQAASAGLEQLAEDGDASGLGAELVAADADGQGGVITGAAGPIATNEFTSLEVSVDGSSTSMLSLAAMLLPSNDAFIGNGDAVTLFNGDGEFVGAQTLVFDGEDVYDAGTEVNTELDAAFINQTGPNTGVDENGVVGLHPGFNGSDGNPEGEGDQIILGGTNVLGEFIDPEVADFTLPGAQIAVVHINTVVEREGTSQADFIFGRADDDLVNAGDGRDIVAGGDGWDVINGDGGSDALFGQDGDDQINGGEGRDGLFGENGNDVLEGGRDNDSLVGGFGDDVFVFASGDGSDEILDFDRLGDDKLSLDVDGIDSFADVEDVASQDGNNTVLDFGEGGRITLSRTDISVLDEGDFIFT